MKRIGAVLMVAALCGCAIGTVTNGTGTAPEECGWGDTELVWSGTGTLEDLGLQADSEFPHREVGTAFIVADGFDLLFCFTLAPEVDGWVRGPVPAGWSPPRDGRLPP